MGILNSLNPVNTVINASLAVSTGGASVVAQQALRLTGSVGQTLIQSVGQNLGLPQSMIDAAQIAFQTSTGDVGGAASNLFDAASGYAQAAGGSEMDGMDFGRQLSETLASTASTIAGGADAQEAKAGGRGGSWIMAMARALGAKADQLASQMQSMADKMAGSGSKASDSVEFGAKSQEFGLFMNTATNAIKTAGESLTTAARKN